MADKQEQERESTNELKASLRIRTAYFVCAIIILTFFIIAQFTCKLYGSDNVFQFFSFASTITSIILSVIAIIISFISGDSVKDLLLKFRELYDEIKNVPEKINESIKGITNVSNNFTQIKTQIDNIPTMIDSSIDKMDELNVSVEVSISELKVLVDEIRKTTTDISNKFDDLHETQSLNPSINADISTLNNSQSDNNIWEKIISQGSYMGNLIIYSIYVAYENNKPFNLISLMKMLDKSKINLYCFGYLVVVENTGLLAFEEPSLSLYDDNILKAINVNKEILLDYFISSNMIDEFREDSSKIDEFYKSMD